MTGQMRITLGLRSAPRPHHPGGHSSLRPPLWWRRGHRHPDLRSHLSATLRRTCPPRASPLSRAPSMTTRRSLSLPQVLGLPVRPVRVHEQVHPGDPGAHLQSGAQPNQRRHPDRDQVRGQRGPLAGGRGTPNPDVRLVRSAQPTGTQRHLTRQFPPTHLGLVECEELEVLGCKRPF